MANAIRDQFDALAGNSSSPKESEPAKADYVRVRPIDLEWGLGGIIKKTAGRVLTIIEAILTHPNDNLPAVKRLIKREFRDALTENYRFLVNQGDGCGESSDAERDEGILADD